MARLRCRGSVWRASEIVGRAVAMIDPSKCSINKAQAIIRAIIVVRGRMLGMGVYIKCTIRLFLWL